jgi:3-oxoacyl-[acyl-carrier-protein] synthase II
MPSYTSRRVVITGMSVYAPIGVGLEEYAAGLWAGKNGVKKLTRFDAAEYPVQIAGECPRFDLSPHLSEPEIRRNDWMMNTGSVFAGFALKDAGFDASPEVPKEIAVTLGSGMGPCTANEEVYLDYAARGWKRIHPFSIPKLMYNNMASLCSLRFNLRGGHHVSAAACAAGAVAMGEAFRQVRYGADDVVLTGAADSPLVKGLFGAWIAMRILSKDTDPETACRPFDKDRTGLVVGEGAAFAVFEELEHARARKARIHAEVIGYADTSDAAHITSPTVDGQARALEKTLKDAGIKREDVDYINAHGTSTAINDATEAQAIRKVFGKKAPPISSTKSMVGHALGASGAMELVATVLAMKEGRLPPTIHHKTADPECAGLDVTPNESRRAEVRVALSNSFAFGGNNSVLALRRWEG